MGENKINSKKFKAMAMALSCLVLPKFFMSAQSSDYIAGHDSEGSVVETSANVSSEEVVSSSKTDESKIKLSSSATNSENNKTEKKNGALNTFLVFLRMVIVLAIVLAIVWIIFKLLQKSSGGSSVSEDKFLRKVSSLTVSPGKSVQVVTLVDKAFLIGVSDNSINLISEITDPELISAMNLYADKNSTTSRPKNFSEVLEIFMPKKGNGIKKNVFEDETSNQILDSLRKKSDRINRGNGQ